MFQSTVQKLKEDQESSKHSHMNSQQSMMAQLEAKHAKALNAMAEDHKASVEKMQQQITSL